MVPHAALARHLRRLAAPPARETAPDAELLGRFVARKDQDAFAVLVARHGPMVNGLAFSPEWPDAGLRRRGLDHPAVGREQEVAERTPGALAAGSWRITFPLCR
jgi:hypothetical protein